MSDKALKTEQPTPRRIEKARQEGQFASARQFVGALQFLAFLLLLNAAAPHWIQNARASARHVFMRAFRSDLGSGDLVALSTGLLWNACTPLLACGAILALVTLTGQLAVTRLGVSLKKVAPDIKRLNPISRMRDLPRQNVPALLQAIVMLPVFGAVVYGVASRESQMLFSLPMQHLESGMAQVATSALGLLWKAAAVFVVFGLVDLVRQRRLYRKDLRMSKQEIRDEIKELEGNPHIKARIRRLGRDLLRRRMIRDVPTATAVVVNPTHYAVALRYAPESMGAPLVVAKGKNHLALRIRSIALEHKVPLVENPPLAQALYKGVEIGQEIPAHLYRAVAEILAYIYRVTNRRPPQ